MAENKRMIYGLVLLFAFVVNVRCSSRSSYWGNWTPCSVSFGGGTRTRTKYTRTQYCDGLSSYNTYYRCMSHGQVSVSSNEVGTCNKICYNGGLYTGVCSCKAPYYGTCCGIC